MSVRGRLLVILGQLEPLRADGTEAFHPSSCNSGICWRPGSSHAEGTENLHSSLPKAGAQRTRSALRKCIPLSLRSTSPHSASLRAGSAATQPSPHSLPSDAKTASAGDSDRERY
jgi:hypothetical protein